MSYLAKGMMHQIESFSLFLRKITSCLVLMKTSSCNNYFLNSLIL